GQEAVQLGRLRYSPVRVSIRSTSPMLMNGGTVIFSPVSVIAGLYWAAAVAPFTDGSVWTTFCSTVGGSSMSRGLPSYIVSLTVSFSFRYFIWSPSSSVGSGYWSYVLVSMKM